MRSIVGNVADPPIRMSFDFLNAIFEWQAQRLLARFEIPPVPLVVRDAGRRIPTPSFNRCPPITPTEPSPPVLKPAASRLRSPIYPELIEEQFGPPAEAI